MIDPNLDDHAAIYAAEVAGLEPGRWDRWIDAVEKELGHSADGDQAEDGYSWDGFYDMWKNGLSVADAVARTNTSKQAVTGRQPESEE